MAKRYEEGRDLCDCIFYLPSTNCTLLSTQTVNQSTNTENIACRHFGVVITNFHRFFKYYFKTADPSQMEEEEVRKKVLNKMKHFINDSRKREKFRQLNFHFVENEAEMANKYHKFFDSFVSKLKELSRQENDYVLNRCIEDISFFLTIGCMQFNQEDSEDIQAVFEQCRAVLETKEAETPLEFADFDITGPEEEGLPLADQKIHYATLQKWLRNPTPKHPDESRPRQNGQQSRGP